MRYLGSRRSRPIAADRHRWDRTLSLATRLRKTLEGAGRAISLARADPAPVVPSASYSSGADCVVVLQRGENPSTDYYLRPRLEASPGLDWVIADLDERPQDVALFADPNRRPRIVFCRYANPAWLAALEAAAPRLAGVSLFMDDDLPAMVADRSLPAAARGKVARHYARHAEALSKLTDQVWVSTPELARRYPAMRATVLEPVPEADPPAPSPADCRLIVYHGTDVHGAERHFALEVACRFPVHRIPASFEITGDDALAADARSLAHVSITPQRPWPEYRSVEAGRQAAILLGPLQDSAVNGARASVKRFDAARLGAAGVYADALPYAADVTDGKDGLLLSMEPDAWVAALIALMENPACRQAIAEAARLRLIALRRKLRALP